jgi:hypothetical protein
MDGRRHRLSDPALNGGGLDRSKPYKPLDVGNGIVSGTVAPNGRLHSLGMAHPVIGRLWLTSTEPFPEASRGDEDAVRRHRAALAARNRPSFGLSLLDVPADAFLDEDSVPRAVYEDENGRIEVWTVAPAYRTGLVQLIRVTAGPKARILVPEWSGRPRLGRADYTQITEGGTIPHPPVAPIEGRDGPVIWIDDRVLDAAVAVLLPGPVKIGGGATAELILAVALGRDLQATLAEARAISRDGARLVADEIRARRSLWTGLGLDNDRGYEVRRGVAYALDCAASRIGDNAVAIITDHEILPLVWTRDAYYICRALLSAAPRETRVRAAVDGFIAWLFEVAERPDGAWPRASLASGQAKDVAFQLDQQLYPLLLVADHARLTGDNAMRERYGDACRATLDELLGRRSSFGLVPTAETPADDPLRQPYHFSSHVLLWHVLRAFSHPSAGEIRAATLEHFAVDGRFAYAVTGPRGEGARHYHDANDLPTVFAPGWEFCLSSEPLWRETIAFAWSEANEGYFPGRFGGLGSLHTPRPWTLGDLQEIVVARVTADRDRERRARERLARVETWDGLLAEAYDEATGAVAARHWFAWPAALRALLEREPMLTAP